MATMRAVQVTNPHGALELVEREIPRPGAGMVRVKVLACGICHSDMFTKEAAFPGIAYPRVPGHEVAGVIDALGEGVAGWSVGQRVGIGWHGGHCGHCDSCRRGDFLTCQNGQVPGISYDGGYADYMLAPAIALARLPEGIDPIEAGPLMCAGITMFNSLRNAGARGGDVVAVLGVGGLGHLGVQYAAKMGYRVVAVARGAEKGALAAKLGASQYIDSQSADPAAELAKLGGASVILATATDAGAISASIGGLAIGGKLMLLGAPAEPLTIPAAPLILGRRSICGWPCGTAIDSEDTLNFSQRVGVHPMTEVYPLERAAEAYERMMSGKARFRVVLTTCK